MIKFEQEHFGFLAIRRKNFYRTRNYSHRGGNEKIYRYFIPGIIVICLISGFASAISIDSDNSTFISIPAQNSDQSNPSFSQIPYVNEYVIGN